MQTASVIHETHNNKAEGGIVYRTTCQNPGCSHTFDLRVTPANASLLSGTMACPRCRRHGGMLKPQGRLGNKLFSAKLVFRLTGVVPRIDEDEAADVTELR
ncbi:MAG: hypothetical protein JOZ29_09955 [Deltaproteobacteria bacterium]|nr:hypothetical protein [Deltaproteobacteria bacterium]MBV8452582.1 hypothetical protein [Deltaproteobacteria bacterium]